MRPTRVLLAVSAAALVAAGCGDDSTSGTAAPATDRAATSSPAAAGDLASLSAEQILAKAKAAIKAADSVRLKGGGSSSGQSFQVDMRYSSDGKAIGTVSNAGRTVELRRVGQVVYLKADAAFWSSTAGAQAAKVLGGKYLKAPLTDQRVASLAAFTEKDAFVDEALKGSGTLSKGGTKDVRGTPTIGVVSKQADSGGTLYVATTGQPYPLQLVPSAGGTDRGSLDFLDYGKPITVAVPPAAQTVDVSSVGGN